MKRNMSGSASDADGASGPLLRCPKQKKVSCGSRCDKRVTIGRDRGESADHVKVTRRFMTAACFRGLLAVVQPDMCAQGGVPNGDFRGGGGGSAKSRL